MLQEADDVGKAAKLLRTQSFIEQAELAAAGANRRLPDTTGRNIQKHSRGTHFSLKVGTTQKFARSLADKPNGVYPYN